jgi:7-cyano-7-deazaguanine synthase
MAAWQAGAAGVHHHAEIDLSSFAALVKEGSALIEGTIPVPDLDSLDATDCDQPPTYVPNRNMVLLSVAAAYAEAHEISDTFYGAQAQDRYGYWDCTVDFIDGINDLLRLNRRAPVVIHAPFARMRKATILKVGQELGVDYTRTWSCYRGGAVPCGTCPTCVERTEAFREAGIEEPLPAGNKVAPAGDDREEGID